MDFDKPMAELKAREERFKRHEDRLKARYAGKDTEISMIMDTAWMLSSEISGIDFVSSSIKELTEKTTEIKNQIVWWLGATVALITVITTVTKFI